MMEWCQSGNKIYLQHQHYKTKDYYFGVWYLKYEHIIKKLEINTNYSYNN